MERLSSDIFNTFEAITDTRRGYILRSCSYLRVCMDNTLRLSPPIDRVLLREVLAGEQNICGPQLPQGTKVRVSIYALHHDKMYFEDSFTFRPERHHGARTRVSSASDPHFAFAASSNRIRSCIGKCMAYMELTTIVARKVWLYDMQLKSGNLPVSKRLYALEALKRILH